MKKILFGMAASIAFAVTAHAAPEQVTAGQVISETGDGVDHACSLLGERVSVSLSSDVVAAFDCVEVESAINIATCHTAGQRAARDVQCVQTGTNADGDPTYNMADCTSSDDTIAVDLSYTGYVASSTGGSVAEAPLTGSCEDDASTLTNLEIFAE